MVQSLDRLLDLLRRNLGIGVADLAGDEPDHLLNNVLLRLVILDEGHESVIEGRTVRQGLQELASHFHVLCENTRCVGILCGPEVTVTTQESQ